MKKIIVLSMIIFAMNPGVESHAKGKKNNKTVHHHHHYHKAKPAPKPKPKKKEVHHHHHHKPASKPVNGSITINF